MHLNLVNDMQFRNKIQNAKQQYANWISIQKKKALTVFSFIKDYISKTLSLFILLFPLFFFVVVYAEDFSFFCIFFITSSKKKLSFVVLSMKCFKLHVIMSVMHVQMLFVIKFNELFKVRSCQQHELFKLRSFRTLFL